MTLPRLALILAGGLAAMSASCAPLPTTGRAQEPTPPAESRAGIAAETGLPALVEAHNRARAEAKLPPLRAEPRLTEAARLHALDMAAHAKMTHEGSDGSTPAERVKRQGYPYQGTAENVAMGQRSVAEVMDAWMHSPGHRKNILGDFAEIGAARATAPDGVPYWTVVFGKPWPRLDPDRAAAEVLSALNARRREAGKPALQPAPKLEAVARRHAEDNAARGKIAGEDRDGVAPLDRVKSAGYRFRSLSLAEGSGYPTAEAVVASWMDDARTRADLLGPFADVGIGYAHAADGMPFWCLILGQPLP